MSTFPFANNVAVEPDLAMVMLLVEMNVPTLGSYSSALVRVSGGTLPPAMSTSPLPKNVAVWTDLATVILPVAAAPRSGRLRCGTFGSRA